MENIDQPEKAQVCKRTNNTIDATNNETKLDTASSKRDVKYINKHQNMYITVYILCIYIYVYYIQTYPSIDVDIIDISTLY
jgi:hypothetical protein